MSEPKPEYKIDLLVALEFLATGATQFEFAHRTIEQAIAEIEYLRAKVEELTTDDGDTDVNG